MPGRRKRIYQFATHLVTAGADAGSYRRDEIRRARSEFASERLDRRNGGPRKCPTPTCVHGGDDAAPAIDHEERHTVGGANGNGNIRGIRNQHICFGTRPRCVRSAAKGDHLTAVHLGEHRHVSSPDRLGELPHAAGG